MNEEEIVRVMEDRVGQGPAPAVAVEPIPFHPILEHDEYACNPSDRFFVPDDAEIFIWTLGQGWWCAPDGIKNDKSKAFKYTKAGLGTCQLNNGEHYLVWRIPKKEPESLVPEMTDFFNQQFIELIKIAPNNMMIRGHMMKKFLVMPPKEEDTYDKIEAWMKANIKKPQPPPTTLSAFGRFNRTTPGATNRPPSLELEFSFNSTEHGTARYSVDRYSTQEHSIDLDDLIEYIDDAEPDMDELIEWLADNAEQECEVDWEYGDYQYSDEDLSDTSDHSTIIRNRTTASERVLDFLRTHSPRHAAMVLGEDYVEPDNDE